MTLGQPDPALGIQRNNLPVDSFGLDETPNAVRFHLSLWVWVMLPADEISVTGVIVAMSPSTTTSAALKSKLMSPRPPLSGVP